MSTTDIDEFSQAIDKVWKGFATQEIAFEADDFLGKDLRQAIQYVELKFQQQLEQARAAFYQTFRNHSVVVDSEVRKIRQELTEKLEKENGDKISELRTEAAKYSAQVAQKIEDAKKLRALVVSQEVLVASIRHRARFDEMEQLRNQRQELQDQVEHLRHEKASLEQQLLARDEHNSLLEAELNKLESKLEAQAGAHAEEKKEYEEKIRGIRMEMKQKEDSFQKQMKLNEERLASYRDKTEKQLKILEIINQRREDALQLMEEERERHIKSRTKPTARIQGEEPIGVMPQFADFELAKEVRYRVDPLGMDTTWKDYPPPVAVPPKAVRTVRTPKIKAERIGPRPYPAAPMSTDGPRSWSPASQQTPREPAHRKYRAMKTPTLPQQGEQARWAERPSPRAPMDLM
mmetsp:Transcript_12363/g.27388  ORF Transcript_12363/g.27388 Transcript_12363/m.27388 type:complete len:404 (-) Transcript_12363:126-1337(-)